MDESFSHIIIVCVCRSLLYQNSKEWVADPLVTDIWALGAIRWKSTCEGLQLYIGHITAPLFYQ